MPIQKPVPPGADTSDLVSNSLTAVMALLGLVYLLFANFALDASMPSLVQSGNITSTTQASTVGSPQPECIRHSFWLDQRPPYLDCHRAVLIMPQNDTLGTFHVGGKSDDFELPQYGIDGGCKVEIDISKFHLWDEGSWSEIRYATSALNLACRDMSTKPWRSGGWLMTGKYGRIKISLTGIWGGDVMGNGLDAM
ncbi:hypothetical protein N7G274_008561 [Stereocaulon virgatum]|uniref:Uncharacterized protein n=1 Tax=Stereocaulon virgatum TaxID=373712 RepID=A0ABR3ZZJ4_9LECA